MSTEYKSYYWHCVTCNEYGVSWYRVLSGQWITQTFNVCCQKRHKVEFSRMAGRIESPEGCLAIFAIYEEKCCG